jgi:hypothetical protein
LLSTSPSLSTSPPDYSPSPVTSPPCSHLPIILPTRCINLKHDKIILYSVINITDIFTTLDLTLFSSTIAQINAILSLNPPTTVPNEYMKFTNVFEPKNSQKLPPYCLGINHEIPFVPNAKPIYGPIYNLSKTKFQALKEYIDNMIAKGCICPFKSPFDSPVLFIKKPDSSLCLCVDYHKLNNITIKNRYALSFISEIFDCLKNAKYFTYLDIVDVYNQL